MFSRLKIQVSAAISALISMLIIGTVIFHYMEKWTWIQSFYFSVVTLTTVGYGDLHPTTEVTRLFTAFYILAGVAITLTSLTVIGAGYFNRRRTNVFDNIIEKTKEKAINMNKKE
jgi:voltage-gated potassium channel